MADQSNTIVIQIKDGVDPQIAPRLISISDASDKAEKSVGNLKAQLSSLHSSGLGSLSSELRNMQGTLAQTVNSTQGMVSANVSAAASMGILEGRTLSMNRAAANFMTRVLGLGPLLQAAFPIIGAVAMLDVLYQMRGSLAKAHQSAVNAAGKIGEAFDGIINPLRRTNDELALSNDKLDSTIAKLEKLPTTNGVVTAIDEARSATDKLDESLERVRKSLDSVLKENAVTGWQSIISGEGATASTSKFVQEQFNSIQNASKQGNDAMNQASVMKDSKAAQSALKDAYENERTLLNIAANNLRDKYNVLQREQAAHDANGLTADQSANMAIVGKAAHLASEEVRELDLTMVNITKNGTADKLRDQVSEQSSATKEAAAQWKALESAFVKYQTTTELAGHKSTAQDSLAWLQSQKVSALNSDKLQAKELPFQNKIIDDSDWLKDHSDKLQNEVSLIGKYSDAVKEQTMLDTIKQEAQKKGITLTEQVIAGYKSQIAAIVESKDYQKELGDIYESVNKVQDIFEARIHALSTEFDAGVLSQNQFNQSIARTIRDYREASDAVVAFQRKLSDQQRDAGNHLGSNRDIAVKGELQSLAASMRAGDASHPSGYSETEIATQTAAMTGQIRAQQLRNEVDQASNKLLYEQVNLYDELTVHKMALTRAVQAGTISQQVANAENLKAWIQQNDMQLKSGKGGNIFGGALADYAKSFSGLAKEIKDSFSGVFKTLSDGFADSIGKALTGTKNLGAALKDVARNAVGELISGFIKMGLQYVITMIMQQTASAAALATSTAMGIAAATALGAAWAAPAMAASIASFGGADAVGAAAYTSSIAAATAVTAHADGGYITGPGTARSDSIASWLSNGEYVVNAGATSQHRDLLDAINSGDSRDTISTHFAPQVNASSNGTPRSQMQVQIHNYNGSRVETQQMDENTVRLIIRDEAPSLVAKHAPPVIASQMNNPNSPVSKAVSNNTFATRRR
jgi:hypothetical protein